jgi:hypothetical protein
MPRRASAKAPQEFTRSGPKSQGKEWTAKMPLERADVNLWKSGEVSYLQTHSYSTGLADAGCEKGRAVANMVLRMDLQCCYFLSLRRDE